METTPTYDQMKAARARDRRKERHRERMQTDPEYAERTRAKWRRRNKKATESGYNRERMRRRVAADREGYNAYMREYMKRPEQKHRARLRVYDLALEEYQRILEAQGGLCPICGLELPETPDIDHCHTTGRVRGLLHGHCNRMLPSYATPEMHRRAADYLEASAAA